MLEIYISSG